jgi:hypothetical protein
LILVFTALLPFSFRISRVASPLASSAWGEFKALNWSRCGAG